MAKSTTYYRMLKAEGSRTGTFVSMKDPVALETACKALGGRDLQLSASYYEDSGSSSPCRDRKSVV